MHGHIPIVPTLNLGGWMELPSLSMSDWSQAEDTGRASVQTVSKYYQDYVRMMGLEKRFRNYTMVTGVKQVQCEQIACVKSDVVGNVVDCCDIKHQPVTHATKEEVFSFDNEDELDELSSACSSMTRRRSLSSMSLESGFYGPSPIPAASNITHPSPRVNQEVTCDSPPETVPEPEPSYDLSASIANWDPIINPSLFGYSYKQQSSSMEIPTSVQEMEEYCESVKCNMVKRPCPTHETMFEVTGYQQKPGKR